MTTPRGRPTPEVQSAAYGLGRARRAARWAEEEPSPELWKNDPAHQATVQEVPPGPGDRSTLHLPVCTCGWEDVLPWFTLAVAQYRAEHHQATA